MSNRLKQEHSPYLLQHADNPVDWYPWCEEAFEKAKAENKPVFLSIGYSTCHWCHVMAHESFEHEEIAQILNRYFVAVKVDREERPDIDSVYMSVCQALTGSGGWPTSIFMTPDQKPFYAGTYFPPTSSYGRIGFRELLLAIAEKWEKDRTALVESAEFILSDMIPEKKGAYGKMDFQLPKKAAEQFAKSYDRTYGGFGSAPKFPMPHNLIFLTFYGWIEQDQEALGQVFFTLEQMRRGGIFDQIGFGFSRYSTDESFLVPHFEKMLYDNALLILAYAVSYKISENPLFLRTAKETADYILREMTGEQGEFYSAQDADSEGEEGKYYVWSYEEVCAVLGRQSGEKVCAYFGITRQGNFEGKNIPNLLNGNRFSSEFEQERETLYHYRKKRMKLHLDDKILTSWNSLMICGFSVLYRVTGEKEYLVAAKRNQEFIERFLTNGTKLYVSCRERISSVHGFLDDYACYGAALIALYEVTAERDYLLRAEQMIGEAQIQFADEENGGYFLNGTQNGRLIMQPKETYDGAVPSGNSVMSYCLVRLFQLTGKEEYGKLAEDQLAFLSEEAKRYPAGHSLFQFALLSHLNPPPKITVVLSKKEKNLLPELPIYADVKIIPEETGEYPLKNGKTTYYVCRDQVCLPPVNDLSFLRQQKQR